LGIAVATSSLATGSRVPHIKAQEWKGALVGDGYVAAGNLASGSLVIEDMARVFEMTRNEQLEERLLRAIEAGRDAGGQNEGQPSACLVSYDWDVFPYVSLQVEVHDEPVAELRRICEFYKPNISYSNIRPANPESAARMRRT
jgi:uncharacterized Ntn-hydrolase superfamily protein